MKGLVLAAGRGKRLNNITQGENKCLLKVNGKPIIQYTMEHLCNLKEITECIVVVGYKAEEVMNCLGNEMNGIKIIYCKQEEQKGLIHAMESAINALSGDDFMLVLGDEFIINNNYQDTIHTFYSSNCSCMIGVIKVDDINLVKKTYTFRFNDEQEMIDFIEKPEEPFNNYMGTGNVLFKGNVIYQLENVPVNPIRGEKELVGLFNLLLQSSNKISSFVVGDQYFNLNTCQDIELLNAAVVNNEECNEFIYA